MAVIAGNMTQKKVNEQTISMTYNAANELKTMQSEKGKIAYSYDQNGNLTQKELDGKKDAYQYDALNRLTSYVGYDGYQQRYTYNAQSMMSARETKGNPTRQTLEEIVSGKKEEPSSDDDPDPAEWVKTSYTYDVTAPYYEVLTEMTNGVKTSYDYGIERLSSYSGSSAWNTIKNQYVYDGRGSVAQELSNNNSWYTFGGALAKRTKTSYSYTPFGELLDSSTAKTTFFAYNGESYDSATGMVNLRARQYEPQNMRFSQRDIIRGFTVIPSTQNRYTYCLNNPILFTDPSGEFVLAALLIGAAIGAIIGGVSSYKAQKAATGKVDGWKVAKDALISGVVGGVAGVVGAAVAGALATAVGATTLTAAGLTTTLTLAQSVGVMSVSAVAAGTVARATNAAVRNSFTNEPKRDVAKEAFNPKAMTTDAVVGGISGVAAYYSTGGVYSTTSIDSRYKGGATPANPKPTQGGKTDGSTVADNPLDDAVKNSSGEYVGEQYGGAAQGESAGTTACSAGQIAGEWHHIASDKSLVSGYTEQYDKIFRNAGMSLQDDANLMFLQNHSGAHTTAYKEYVLNTLTEATEGLSGNAAKDALIAALDKLKAQLLANPLMPYKGGLN